MPELAPVTTATREWASGDLTGPTLVRRSRDSVGDLLEEADDLRLSGSGRVELATHLCETSIDVVAKVDEILAQRIEAGRGGSAEISDLTANLTDISVSATGEYAGGRRVLITCADAIVQVADLLLK